MAVADVTAYVQGMSETANRQDFARQLAVLEERMNTMQAEYEGALDRFRGDMERFRADNAKRETGFQSTLRLHLFATVGTTIAAIGLGVTFLARRDGPPAPATTPVIIQNIPPASVPAQATSPQEPGKP